MKRVFTILISLALLTSVAMAPVYAGGAGNASGDDAEGNQAP